MPATVTLSTATLGGAIGPSEGRISVSSTAGMTPGLRLYMDGELATVIRLDPVDPYLFVTRGVDGTSAAPHASGTTIYIGRADQFYAGPPVGTPLAAIAVSPYIDVMNGKIYFAQGDASSTSNRFWQQQTVTYDVSSVGVRTATPDLTSST